MTTTLSPVAIQLTAEQTEREALLTEPEDGRVSEVVVDELSPLHHGQREVELRPVCVDDCADADDAGGGKRAAVAAFAGAEETCRQWRRNALKSLSAASPARNSAPPADMSQLCQVLLVLPQAGKMFFSITWQSVLFILVKNNAVRCIIITDTDTELHPISRYQ